MWVVSETTVEMTNLLPTVFQDQPKLYPLPSPPQAPPQHTSMTKGM